MRILVDYRPALRERTGVGEYTHELVRAYTSAHADEVSVFVSSWKDRPAPDLSRAIGASVVDRRFPVRLLNYLWHRAEWPPVEAIAGDYDVVHSSHPLLMPSRRAAQVITIHDLFFMSGPSRTHREIRRDYAALAPAHARRADAIVTSTEYGRRLVLDHFGVGSDRVYVCPPGAPSWRELGSAPRSPREGCILFVGTLEPRKNVGALLDAYTLLVSNGRSTPPLVLAGRATSESAEWLRRIERPPLAGRVRHLGYFADEERERLYASARVLVIPSLDEGFGLPALEAMSAGVPVIASRRGSLPEVVGNAGILVEPDDIEGLAAAIDRVVCDTQTAMKWGREGLERARAFTWPAAAATLRRAYADAVARRQRTA
jgi:glycosyltransferase involved in cell wall biosynthesis